MDFDIQESDAGFRIFESKFYCGVISVKISSDTDPLDKKHANKSTIKCSNIYREREISLQRDQWDDQNVRTTAIRKYSIFTQKVKIF